MKRFQLIVFAAIAVLFLVPAATAHAQDGGVMDDDAWHGEVMPYVWSTGIYGTLRVQQQSVSIKASFSDLWTYVNFGGSLYGAAQKGHFTSYGQWRRNTLLKLQATPPRPIILSPILPR